MLAGRIVIILTVLDNSAVVISASGFRTCRHTNYSVLIQSRCVSDRQFGFFGKAFKISFREADLERTGLLSSRIS